MNPKVQSNRYQFNIDTARQQFLSNTYPRRQGVYDEGLNQAYAQGIHSSIQNRQGPQNVGNYFRLDTGFSRPTSGASTIPGFPDSQNTSQGASTLPGFPGSQNISQGFTTLPGFSGVQGAMPTVPGGVGSLKPGTWQQGQFGLEQAVNQAGFMFPEAPSGATESGWRDVDEQVNKVTDVAEIKSQEVTVVPISTVHQREQLFRNRIQQKVVTEYEQPTAFMVETRGMPTTLYHEDKVGEITTTAEVIKDFSF